MEIQAWLVRNPLGIIALFISLIYGMSALLLGATVSKLTAFNQSSLVIFIILFPIIVLIVFYLLVTRHHQKLYAPGDFKEDRSFLDAIGKPLPRALGARIEAEVLARPRESALPLEVSDPLHFELDAMFSLPSQSDQQVEASDSPMPSPPSPPSPLSAPSHAVQEVYALRSLVFQELQDQLNGSIRREVRFSFNGTDTIFDGIIIADGHNSFVDIIVSNDVNLPVLMNKAERKFHNIRRNSPNSRYIVVFVYINLDHIDDLIDDVREDLQARSNSYFEVLVYSDKELYRKYGFYSPTLERHSSRRP